ncbi:MAG: CBS domain-containing protein [bacterium]
MKVQSIMTSDPACCTPDTGLQKVARLMLERDCGEIPVVESRANMKPVGVVTDRDIVTRAVAEGRNPLHMAAKDCMTSPILTVTPDMSVEDCVRAMEERQVRRVPVVDEAGRCCGMVSQADIAQNASERATAGLVKEVSQPGQSQSPTRRSA